MDEGLRGTLGVEMSRGQATRVIEGVESYGQGSKSVTHSGTGDRPGTQ